MKDTIIQPYKFADAFQKIGWDVRISKSEEYYIWVDPKDENMWVRLPRHETNPHYITYQRKSTSLLMYALDMPENKTSADEIISQLEGYNYKLISRILGINSGPIDRVPYELATEVTKKNTEAFRHFALTKKNGRKRAIPIDKFELNHTRTGSFVIPISLSAEEDSNETLLPKQSATGVILHEYLNMLDKLIKAPRSTAEAFAENVVGDAIDSKIVKSLLAKEGSVAKYSSKYSSMIGGIIIEGRSSPILDFRLDEKDKKFKDVELTGTPPVEDEYIKAVEDLELRSNDSSITENKAKIEVVVDTIDRTGKARFTVMSINDEEIKRPFKAMGTEMSITKLNECAAHFATGSFIVIGDVAKMSGRMGTIKVNHFEDSAQISLFKSSGMQN
jgi:hypothetical protein